MFFHRMLTIIIFALVIYLFIKMWSKLMKSGASESINDSQTIQEKISELNQKRAEFETLKKTVDIQEKINHYQEEIEKIDQHIKKLKEQQSK